MPTSTYTAIASTTLDSAQSSVTFSSISGYRDLILSISAPSVEPLIRFNGDTGNNYTNLLMRGTDSNTAVTSSATESSVRPAVASWGGSVTVSIMDYSTTDKHKTSLARTAGGSSNFGVTVMSSRWANTAAITSITISSTGFSIGSKFSLWGVIA